MLPIKLFVIVFFGLIILLPNEEWRSTLAFFVALGVGYLANEIENNGY